ncbi:MAG: class I SAM-dependent methyltransferase [Syntrophobacteraceae bacterium]
MPLEHKPLYPFSELHVTIYDGDSLDFARKLLDTLREYVWQLRVRLPANTSLTAITLKPSGNRKGKVQKEYSDQLKKLFWEITSKSLSLQYVAHLSDEERLGLVRLLCAHLHGAGLKRIPPGVASQRPNEPEGHGREVDGISENDKMSEIHLTPPELALAITEYAVGFLPSSDPVDFGDPAVGTGAFFSALLRTIPPDRIASSIGIDIGRKQVDAAQRRWGDRGMRVMLGDYLHMERLPRRSLILANPPYLRHQDIPPKYKQVLRERASVKIGRRISGLSGLYVYFLLLSHDWMEDSAIAAWLIPSEFIQTAYGACVRDYLTRRVQLIRIHQFGQNDPQFENAMVLPLVIVFRNSNPNPDHNVVLSSGGTIESPELSESINIKVLRGASRWQIPWRSWRQFRNTDVRIGDLFDVRRGIATGANGFFILERRFALRLGIPEIALRPVLPKVRTLDSDIVEREADGYPAIQPQLVLLDCDLPEKEILIRYPKLMEYLESAAEQGILERNLIKSRHPWYKQEQRDPPRFLCTYMGRGRGELPPLRFIWNKSDAVATNTYILLYPKPPLDKLLQAEDGAATEIFGLLKKSAVETIDERSRVYAGGLRKVEPGELRQVRLPTSLTWLRRTFGFGNLPWAR